MITKDQLTIWEADIKHLKSQYPPPETPLSLLQHFSECIAELKRLREDESRRLDQMQSFSYSTAIVHPRRHAFYTGCPMNTSI